MFTDEELAGEEWRPVVGWESRYEVSSLGHVRSKPRDVMQSNGVMKRHNERAIVTVRAKSGHARVRLIDDNGNKRTLRVDTLVASAFLENAYGCESVVHIDGNNSNDALSNLSWDLTSRVCEDETWAPVVGWEGLYEISDAGNVRSAERDTPDRNGMVVHHRSRMMKIRSTKEGYLYVRLRRGMDESIGYIDRMVAEAYVPNPCSYVEVGHYNSDLRDNRASNLYWCKPIAPSTAGPDTTFDNEEWRPVVGWAGYYEVSSEGRVRSVSRTINRGGIECELPDRYLQLALNAYGYPCVGLSKDGHRVAKGVHRLVAEAFIPNPDGLPEVDHVNGVRNDNKVSNLRWCTHTENVRNRVFDKSRNITEGRPMSFYNSDERDEEWRPVVGYEESYEVSNRGHVRSLTRQVMSKNGHMRTIRGKSLSTKPGRYGYCSVSLCANGTRQDYSVHKLVAEAFIPNPEHHCFVRHVNGIESDNRVENLIWKPHCDRLMRQKRAHASMA